MTKPNDLQGEAADHYSGGWTIAMRRIADIGEIDSWDAHKVQALAAIANQLADVSLMSEPLVLHPPWATEKVVRALAQNARASYEKTGYQDPNGKKNASVAQAADTLLRKLGAISYVEQQTGLRIDEKNIPMWYITYEDAGAGLGLHLDTRPLAMSICYCASSGKTREV